MPTNRHLPSIHTHSDLSPRVSTLAGTHRAIVLGAGIAGLLAAQALAEHVDEVCLIDRDRLADDEHPRKGTPQARHIHGLLTRGLLEIERLLPGLTEELRTRGAPFGDALGDTRLHFGGHTFRPGPAGLPMLSVSRPVLESAIRRRVTAHPRVRVLDQRDAVGLATTADGRRIRGVHTFSRTDGSADELLSAGLVIDATGRGSRMPAWRESMGLRPAPEERLNVGVSYTSALFRLPEAALGTDFSVISAPTPDRPRGGAMNLIEDGQALVTLIGVRGDRARPTPADFLEFSRDLAMADLPRLIAEAEPLCPPAPYRHAVSVRHRYDLAPTPAGLLVIGDALCTLNPVYGQGMTVAALQATALADALSRRRTRGTGVADTPALGRAMARIAGQAWSLSRGADLAFGGNASAAERSMGRYIDRVQARAAIDPVVGAAFLRVTTMVKAPSALMSPRLLARVFRPLPSRPPHQAPADTGQVR